VRVGVKHLTVPTAVVTMLFICPARALAFETRSKAASSIPRWPSWGSIGSIHDMSVIPFLLGMCRAGSIAGYNHLTFKYLLRKHFNYNAA
jgi:hypothetical protein